MSAILKGEMKNEPTTVRFEPGQLEKAKDLRINVSEVSRQALQKEIERLDSKRLQSPKEQGKKFKFLHRN